METSWDYLGGFSGPDLIYALSGMSIRTMSSSEARFRLQLDWPGGQSAATVRSPFNWREFCGRSRSNGHEKVLPDAIKVAKLRLEITKIWQHCFRVGSEKNPRQSDLFLESVQSGDLWTKVGLIKTLM